jgi:signal transduction histidine kinase
MRLTSALLTCLTCLIWLIGLGAAAPAASAAQPKLAVLEDPTGELTIDQVRAQPQRFEAWPTERGPVNLGLSDSAYWIRVELDLPHSASADWVLELPYFQLRTVDFFAPGRDAVRTGAALPLSSRPYLHRFFAFPLAAETAPASYFLRVTSAQSLTVPVVVWREQEFLRHVQATLVLQFLYHGGLIALCVYNFFLAISLRDARFLLYCLFVGTFGLAIFAGNGLGQMFLWPGQADFDGIAQFFLLTAAGALAMLFTRHFLQAARQAPRIAIALSSLTAAYALAAAGWLLSLWLAVPMMALAQATFLLTFAAGATVVVAGVNALGRGQKGTRFFLLAWAVLWAGASIATLRAYGVLPTNVLTSYSLQIASTLEMLLLALALADVIHIERDEREAAQQDALLAKQKLLDSAKSSEERLEKAVQERTLQLEAALDGQNQLFKRYVRFAALISHEFRNPLGIVDSQISLLRKEAQLGQLQLEKRLDIMGGATARLLSLFETWMRGDRLQQAMQEMEPQYLPLTAWLRELVDAQTAYHSGHRLELRIAQPVGDIWADESLLEVALLNLIDNACKYSEPGQAVVIEVRARPGAVGVAVIDQGCGIDASDHEAIFEDYYRVQPEGPVTGMGLGLAFVRRIVQMHQGQLELHSARGQGSSFCIWLPAR